VRFFRSPAELRRWFERHHASCREQWIGYRKRATGEPSITWPESVDEALCVGWIDGIRKSIDATSYKIRFTPRKPGSIWSAVNIRRAQALIAEGRMRPAGLALYQQRREYRVGNYSYEQRRDRLDEPYASLLKQHPAAQAYFEAQPPSYRRQAYWYVVSAKQEATRLERLRSLIERWAQQRRD
jgi:uncharacterized protein YdeI (YjbR/CyaY-like superfamily)